VLVVVLAPVNSESPPGSPAGTSQPWVCSARSWACDSGSAHGPGGSDGPLTGTAGTAGAA
jgi:hypothetical protein